MKISVDFGCLVTFDCTFGEWAVGQGIVKIFVEKGLALKESRFVLGDAGWEIIECKGGKGVEDVFPVHYIYDPAREVEYVQWEIVEGYLNARTDEGEYVKYGGKAESLHAMHEYVGGCWFVFSGVTFVRRFVCEYALDKKALSGNRFPEEFGDGSMSGKQGEKYFLEGVINCSPGPGWMSLEIHAESMHIEILDHEVGR